jgi:hypothetical protein
VTAGRCKAYIAALERKSVIPGIAGRYPTGGASRETGRLIAGIEGSDRYLGCHQKVSSQRGARAPCICAMSWQSLNVKLSAGPTEQGEGPTVLYGMLVNMDRLLWRQSVGARACSQEMHAIRMAFEEGKQGAWQGDRGWQHGAIFGVTQMWKVLKIRKQSHGRDVMANSSCKITEPCPCAPVIGR